MLQENKRTQQQPQTNIVPFKIHAVRAPLYVTTGRLVEARNIPQTERQE